jgi:hypothetical protein
MALIAMLTFGSRYALPLAFRRCFMLGASHGTDD